MKVTFLVYNVFGMGGTVRTVVNTANYLVSKGYDIEIVSIRKTRKTPMFNLDSGISIQYLYDARRPKESTVLGSFKQLIKNYITKIPSFLIDRNEDLYHMFNIMTDIKLYRVLKTLKTDILITTIPSFNLLSAKYVSHNIIKVGQEHKVFDQHADTLKKKIYKHYHQLDVLTCLTDEEKNGFEKILSLSKEKIIKIPNGTEIPFQTANLKNKTIIAAGRYVPDKGFDLLIQAFALVNDEFPDWRVKIFGAGIEKEYLREEIFRTESYNNVFLMPKSNKLFDEMQTASIYALSSRHESFGMVIIEAMSVGLPCVAFNSLGPKELIKHEENGLLVDREDVVAFADSLARLMKSYDLREKLGNNAKTYAYHFSLDEIGHLWEKTLIKLSNERRKN